MKAFVCWVRFRRQELFSSCFLTVPGAVWSCRLMTTRGFCHPELLVGLCRCLRECALRPTRQTFYFYALLDLICIIRVSGFNATLIADSTSGRRLFDVLYALFALLKYISEMFLVRCHRHLEYVFKIFMI